MKTTVKALKVIKYNGVDHFVDFRLSEIRPVTDPWSPIRFENIEDEDLKKQLRRELAEGILNQFIL